MRAEAEKARVWILEAANIVTEADGIGGGRDARDAIERKTRLSAGRKWLREKVFGPGLLVARSDGS